MSTKSLKFYLFISLFIVSVSFFSYADSSGADFLKVETSAYANSLGGAFTAIDGNAASAIFNPAALTTQKKSVLAFTGMPWIGDTLFASITYVEPLKKYKGITLGADLTVFSSLTIEQYSIGGEKLGSTSMNDVAASFFISYPLPLKGLSAGGSVKFIWRDLLDYYAYGVACDLALFYKTSFLSFYSPNDENFSIGVTLRNLGPHLIFSEDQSQKYVSKLPTSLNIGMRYIFFKGQGAQAWFVSEMTTYLTDGEQRYKIGLAYQPLSILSFRFGYQSGAELRSFSFGCGIVVPFGKNRIAIDYAFLPLNNEMTAVHALTMSLFF